MVNDYKYLLLTHGIPGAGKSTFIAKCFGKRTDTKIICPDDIREEFKNKKEEWKEHFEYQVWKKVDERLKESLTKNKITIIDATFVSRKSILRQYKTMKKIDPNIKFIIVDFSQLPLEFCLNNNKTRRNNGGRFVPENVIQDMYTRIKKVQLREFKPMTISHNDLEALMK